MNTTERPALRFPLSVSCLLSGARVCIGLSIPGIIFLIVIGVLFDKQGFYTSVDIEDPSAAASDCYFAGEDHIYPTLDVCLFVV